MILKNYGKEYTKKQKRKRGIMAIDFDALDFVRTQNKVKVHERKMSERQKKHELFIDGRKKLDSLANAYNKANDQGIKEVYKKKWFELVKIYANKIGRKQ